MLMLLWLLMNVIVVVMILMCCSINIILLKSTPQNSLTKPTTNVHNSCRRVVFSLSLGAHWSKGGGVLAERRLRGWNDMWRTMHSMRQIIHRSTLIAHLSVLLVLSEKNSMFSSLQVVAVFDLTFWTTDIVYDMIDLGLWFQLSNHESGPSKNIRNTCARRCCMWA